MRRDLMQGVEFSHELFQKHINKGDIVIDATAGNGYDTKFLAELVGKEGFVFAFDIQKQALNNTLNRLKQNNLKEQVKLINKNHADLEKYIEQEVSGILFNLGYLPHGDKNIITKPVSTIAAVKSGLKLLKKKGLMVLVIYPGHDGGKTELESLLKYCQKLNSKKFNVLYYHFINQKQDPAQLLAIKKR